MRPVVPWHLQAIATGWLHPNPNLDDPEEEIDLSCIVGKEKEEVDVKVGAYHGACAHSRC